MKKRILSLLLVAVMIICMVPAISLVSYADNSNAPTVGTYEYYEHLWYDDGHLLSFVDLTHVTDADIVENSESLELEGTDYRIINGLTGYTTTEGLRSFVRIVGGTNEGKYYLITVDKRVDANGTGAVDNNYKFTPTENGMVVIPDRQSTGGYARAVNSGIWLAHAYSADEVTTSFEKGYASATQLDAALDYGTADKLNTFTVNMVMDYHDSATDPSGVALLSVSGLNSTDSNSRYTVAQGETPFYGNSDTITKMTQMYSVIGGIQVDTKNVPGAVTNVWLGYNGRYGGQVSPSRYGGNYVDGDTLSVAYTVSYKSQSTFGATTAALVKTGDWVTATSKYDKSTAITTEYPSYGAHVQMSGLMANIPDATNMFYMRIYDCALTEEQLKQNHFADLCYYYNIDLTAYNNLTNKFKNQVIEGAQMLKLGDDTYGKSDLEALIANVLLDAMPEFGDASSDYSTSVVDTELEKYIDLYYDDGHLMSMMNLSNITEDEVVYNGDKVDINGARVVLGNLHEENGQYDSYVRILAGKYAGDYYRLGNQGADDKFTLQIEIDDEGFIKYNECFQQWGAKVCGVMYSNTYDESTLNTVKPRAKEKSDFIYNTEYLQYDNTYGNFTQEGVYRMACDFYTQLYPTRDSFSLLMAFGYHSGSFVIKSGKNGTTITSFYSGTTHGNGTQRETNYAANETYHYMARVAFTSPTTMFRSIYVYHYDKGMQTTTAGKEPGYDLNQIKNDRTQFTAHNQGMKMYVLRLYDVSLTPEQMKQNHFADLCYYYGLENTDQLLKLGSYILNDAFYSNFQKYNLGMCDQGDINSMQSTINSAINAALNADKVIANIAANYQSAVANAISSQQSLAAVQSILNGIDAYITQVKGMVAVNDESEQLFEECVLELEAIKDNVNLYYLIVLNYNENVQTVKEIATEINGSTNSQTDTDTLLANNNLLDGKMHYSTAGALNNAKFAELAAEGNADIARIVAEANSVNAQTSFDATDYLKFAGYQVRVTDFAAMRALFAVDTDAIAEGYTYGNLSYEIVCVGFMIVDAESTDATVTYDGKYVTAKDSGAIIKYVDSWNYEADMDSKVSSMTGIDGAQAHSIIKTYDGVGYNDLAQAYQKEYRLRAFIVLEGEGTSFIRYYDAESVNAGDTVSVYELAKYASTVESAENLADEYYITRVITAVDGKDA